MRFTVCRASQVSEGSDRQRPDHAGLLMASDGTVVCIGARLAWRKRQRAFAASAGGHVQFRLVACVTHHMTGWGVTAGCGFAADLNLGDTPIVFNCASVLEADGHRLARLYTQRCRYKRKLFGRYRERLRC